MLEPSWDEQILKAAYIKRILEIKAIINPQDKVIFVATKADKFMNTRDIFHKIKLTYSGLFDAFKNKNPITRLIRPYNFDFVAFSAGTFSNNIDGTDMYCVGDDKYPEILWKTVLKNI